MDTLYVLWNTIISFPYGKERKQSENEIRKLSSFLIMLIVQIHLVYNRIFLLKTSYLITWGDFL